MARQSCTVTTLRELVRAWRTAEGQEERLEKGFSTRTCNIGGAHCERFEYRPENLHRTTNTVLPGYNALSDPHLVRYKNVIQRNLCRSEGLPASTPRRCQSADPRARSRPTSADPRSSSNGEFTIITLPLGTEHVLSVKRIFYEWSISVVGDGCRSATCAATTVCSPSSNVRLLFVRQTNIHDLVCKGIDATNSFCSIHQMPPVSYPSMALLYEWLVVLGCLSTVDWPSFLILCSVNLQTDYSTVAELRYSYDSFVSQKPLESEQAFHELLEYMLGHRLLRQRPRHDPDKTQSKFSSFFQPSDFYTARHTCSFAEFLTALLYPRRVQFYVTNARARGPLMDCNFCGHCGITLSPRRSGGEDAVDEAKRRAAERHNRIMKRPLLSKRDITVDQAKRARYQRRVWA